MPRFTALSGLALVLPALLSPSTHATPPSCAGQANKTSHKAIGDGTAASPWLLCNATQLKSLGNASADWGAVYALGADITLSSLLMAGMKPIGTSAVPFSGQLLGYDRSITNYTLSQSTASHLGVFGVVSGHIERLRVVNPTLFGATNVGGAVGSLLAGGTLVDVHVRGGSVRANVSNVGGVVGSAAGSVTRASAAGTTIVGRISNAGGLVGWLAAGGAIADSYAHTAVDTAGVAVGGLVGGAGAGASIVDAYAAGSVATNGPMVGGLVGSCQGATIDGAFAAATVVGRDDLLVDPRVGRFVGAKSCASVTHSFYDRLSCTNTGAGDCASDMAGVTGIWGVFFPEYFTSPSTDPLASWDFVDTWIEVPDEHPALVGAP